MPIYIEHDYYPMDVMELDLAGPRQRVTGQTPAPYPLLDQEKTGLQTVPAESMEAA